MNEKLDVALAAAAGPAVRNLLRTQTCGKCKFAEIVPNEQFPECRRFPPHVQMMAGKMPNGQPVMQKMTHFPSVHPDAWCGEYIPKLAIQN